MSESLKTIERFKKQILTELYLKLKEKQRRIFDDHFGSVGAIQKEKIERAIILCERTIKKNIEEEIRNIR